MKRQLISNTLVFVLLALPLSGCSTLFKSKSTPTTETVCDPVKEPPREPLRAFQFYPLPAGTKSEGGVELRAGLSEEGVVAVLDNLAKLQRREGKWQGRTEASNKCLETEAKQRAERNAKR